MKMIFKCFDNKEEWIGKITEVKNSNCYEFMISSRTSILTILGTTSRGNFACFPDFNLGCHLVNLKDKFWNKEKLVEVLGKVDGITVSCALDNLASKVIL